MIQKNILDLWARAGIGSSRTTPRTVINHHRTHEAIEFVLNLTCMFLVWRRTLEPKEKHPHRHRVRMQDIELVP